jgi:hypothetical protein
MSSVYFSVVMSNPCSPSFVKNPLVLNIYVWHQNCTRLPEERMTTPVLKERALAMKNTLFVSLSVLTSLALVACGGNAQNESAQSQASRKPQCASSLKGGEKIHVVSGKSRYLGTVLQGAKPQAEYQQEEGTGRLIQGSALGFQAQIQFGKEVTPQGGKKGYQASDLDSVHEAFQNAQVIDSINGRVLGRIVNIQVPSETALPKAKGGWLVEVRVCAL